MVLWSDLPRDLIQSIAKYTTPKDQLVFGALCTNWGSTLNQDKCHPPPSLSSHHLPWLLLPRRNPACVFYSLLEDKFYSIDVPEAFIYRCCGSCQGWLIMCGKTPELFMFNPITRSRIELPPLTTFPHVFSYSPSNFRKEYRCGHLVGNFPEEENSSRYMERFWIEKVILTANPCLDDDFIVMAIYGNCGFLGYCRKGDDKWTHDGLSDFHDLIYWKGLFYGVTGEPSLVQCNLNGPFPVVNTLLKSRIIFECCRHYIVVCSDELLMIARFYSLTDEVEFEEVEVHEETNYDDAVEEEVHEEEEDYQEDYDDYQENDYPQEDDEYQDYFCEYSDIDGYFMTRSFRVYKPDLENQIWERVQNIGDHALFIGNNQALSFKAKDFPGCKPNHIYFSNDQVSPGWAIVTDFGAMDIETRKVEPFRGCSELTDLLRPAPVWIMPSLH